MAQPTIEVLAPGDEQGRFDVALRAAFAESAVQKVFGWLEIHSPNNAGYLTSSAFKLPLAWLQENAQHIEDIVANGLSGVNGQFEGVDLRRIENLRKGTVLHINQQTGVREPLAKIYVASDIINAGIEFVTKDIELDTPMTEVNEQSARAIGAMLLRGMYFEHLSAKYPERFYTSERDNFLRVFQQNILACVRRAALIEDMQNRHAMSEQQPVQLAIVPVQAVA